MLTYTQIKDLDKGVRLSLGRRGYTVVPDALAAG